MIVGDNKAQGAMEYLMTYAWAILIIIVVGVVLWQMGVFSGGSGANTARGFTKMKILDPSIRYKAGETDDALELMVINAVGQTVSNLVLSTIDGSCSQVSVTVGKELSDNIAVGKSSHFWLTSCENRAVGEQFYVDLVFEYHTTVAGMKITHKDGGTIRGSAE